ncbi:MAG: Nif11-like leader peptide family RiPP precursor [Vicinamibacterales bacterium]
MRWWELSFSWNRAALGVAIARLRQHGLHSCVLDGETDGIARLKPVPFPSAPRALVLGLAHHLEEEARNRGLAPPGVCFRQTDTCEALAAWPPMDIGRRLRVQPAGHPLPPPGERAVVQLLPRAAFGTTHATTRLCLEALEGRELEGSRVADIGCGSGVLALAAIRLGAREVHAVDVDPLAVATTLENRALNAVPEHTLHVTHGSVEALACDRVELILCNTLLAVLEQVIPRMAISHVRWPGPALRDQESRCPTCADGLPRLRLGRRPLAHRRWLGHDGGPQRGNRDGSIHLVRRRTRRHEMSQIKDFWAKVNEGGALSKAMDALMSSGANVPAADVVALGQANGFTFTADELRASLDAASGRELSDAEMADVAGGEIKFKEVFVTSSTLLTANYQIISPTITGIISF